MRQVADQFLDTVLCTLCTTPGSAHPDPAALCHRAHFDDHRPVMPWQSRESTAGLGKCLPSGPRPGEDDVGLVSEVWRGGFLDK